MSRIQAYRGNEPYVFISYAHADTEVQDILAELAAKDYRFWYDEGIQSGSDWADVISERIKNCTQFIAFLSDSAVKSENVKDEIHLAVKYKIDMLVIHLENIVLDGGLELHLDRKQALLKYTYDSKSDFSSKLYQSIKNETIRVIENGPNTALDAFKKQYDILRLDAVNGFSKTYLAVKKVSNTFVLAKHFFQDHPALNPREIARDEMSVLRKLQGCPFAPFLIDYFEDEYNNAIVVKTYVEGEYLDNLQTTFNYNDIETHQDYCVGVALSVAETLLYLHNASEHAIVHRDIKPSNILVNSRGYAIISDFDLCKVLNGHHYPVWGTMGYAPIEQRMMDESGNDMVDARSDIYALGITLLEILTGQGPGNYSKYYDPYYVVWDCDVDMKFSPTLIKIILKMTQLQPDDRYQTIEEVIFALKHYKEEDAKNHKKYQKQMLQRKREEDKKWKNFKKELEKRYSNVKSLETEVIELSCKEARSGNIHLDHQEFLVEEELRNKGIPEENRLHYKEKSELDFCTPEPIRHDCSLLLEFELHNVNNIHSLNVFLNRDMKRIHIHSSGIKYSVTFSDFPTLLELSQDEKLLKIDEIAFVCTPKHLVDEKLPGNMVVSNVTLRKIK